jgi:P4 family phage/plasmid primase-like protien
MFDDVVPAGEYEIESDTFPAELLSYDRWFTWAYDDGRKIPRAPWATGSTDQYVSWKETEYWTDFDEADEWVGKVPKLQHASCIPPYSDNDTERLIFFDFDDVRDPETGDLHPMVMEFIETHGLHAALSTSGTGVHGYGWASLPNDYKPSFEIDLEAWKHGEDAELEVYASARFLALTGEHFANSPVSVPDINETVDEMFRELGEKRVTGHDREPETPREEIEAKSVTADVEQIYDAVSHTKPNDIRLRSSVTEERHDGSKSLDPSWESSESGTRLAEFDDHWLYRKGNHRLDALQVVALEERIITDPADYPSGEDFVESVDKLRNRGAHIPELADPADDVGEAERPATTDGGVSAAEGGERATDNDAEETTTEGWDRVYEQYAGADDGDEKQVARYHATEQLTSECEFRTLEQTDALYSYTSDYGIYEQRGEVVVRKRLVNELREQYSVREHTEVCEQIRGRSYVRELGGPAGLLCVGNGVIDLETEQLADHSPEHEFIGRSPVEYDPEADCPLWREFLQDVVPISADRDKLQEYVGYCLMHWGLPYHKALFLVGPQASGKSTFLDTVRSLLGEDTVASLTPQEMVDERFSAADLHGAWANIRGDIPSGLIENAGTFKEIVAGDEIKAERKFEDPFSFNPTAKHMFSANQLPDASVDDDAFFRRILLVPFPTSVPKSERDPSLPDRLDDELSGIMNWALDGYKRLQEQQRFTADRDPGATRDTWEMWGSTIEQFKQTCLEMDPKEHVPKSDVYSAYVQYCEAEGIPAETQRKLTRELKTDSEIDDARRTVNGRRQRCLIGVSIKDGYGPNQETDTDEDTRSTGLRDY